MEEAQILYAFETFFFSPALKLLVWVSKTFQEVLCKCKYLIGIKNEEERVEEKV